MWTRRGLLPLVLSFSACEAREPAAPAPADTDPRFVGLLDWTRTQMATWHLPGAAIAVVEDGKLKHVSGLGVREWGTTDEVTPDTLFRVGSISKMFTGVLAAQAAADGVLDLDAPASTLLGDLTLEPPASFDDFTFIQLLSHSSGMQTIGVPNGCDTDPTHLGEEFASLTPDWQLWTPPGAIFNYANQGFGLAGLAVERARNELFVEQAQALFDAAGMDGATYSWERANDAEHAVGYTMDMVTGEPSYVHGLDERACVATYPSGGLMVSPTDMGHAMEVLLAQGDGWLTPDAWEILTTRGWNRTETSGYGFGLQAGTYRGFTTLSHHGSLGGYFAYMMLVPSEGLGIVVMVDVDNLLADPPEPWDKPDQRIMLQALNVFLDLPGQPLSSSVLPTDEWSRFVGHWHSDYDLGDVSVNLSGDTLWLSEPDKDRFVPLLPYSSSSFQYAVPGSDDDYGGVSFVSGDDGGIAWVVTGEGVAGVE